MATSRVVRPETSRLEISGGDYLIVKKRLNAGEQRRQFAKIYRDNAAGRMTVDPLQTGVALVVSYLLDWSLVDETGAIIPIRDTDDAAKTAALDALDYDSFVEIKVAIEAHQTANDAETAKKNTIPTGAPLSEPSSRLLAVVGGGLSGSED